MATKTATTAEPKRDYLDRDLKLVYGLSAARCAFGGTCRRPCIEPATAKDREAITGKIAHIEAFSPGGPRYNPNLTSKERNSYPNLILLCGDHHDIIDQQFNTYTVDIIREWKKDHEAWVIQTYRESLPSVSFDELKIAAQALLHAPNLPSENFQVTRPLAKMEKNGLTAASAFIVTQSLANDDEVKRFIAER